MSVGSFGRWVGFGGVAVALASMALLVANCGSGSTGDHAVPVITQVIPDTGGTLGGDTVEIFTANFHDDFSSTPLVFFGTDPATVTGVSPTQTITVITPSHATAETVDVRVEGTGMAPPQTATLAGGFTYELSPLITSLSPDWGGLGGGTVVLVETANFLDDFAVDLPIVRFGGDPAASITAVSPTSVTATTPLHPIAESVDVEVESTGTVQTAVLVDGFNYVDCPGIRLSCDVSGANPDNGPVSGGNQIQVTGGLFCDLNPRVIFGMGGPSVPATFVSDQELTVIVPPATAPGPVELFYDDDIGCFLVPVPFCCYTYN